MVLYLPPDDAGRDGEGKTPHPTASQTPTQNDLKTPHYTVGHPLFSGILQLNTYTVEPQGTPSTEGIVPYSEVVPRFFRKSRITTSNHH